MKQQQQWKMQMLEDLKDLYFVVVSYVLQFSSDLAHPAIMGLCFIAKSYIRKQFMSGDPRYVDGITRSTT